MKVFKSVKGPVVPRSYFDLSYEKKFTCDMGELIPIMCEDVVPGDTFKIGNEIVIRFQPLVAPILHEINVYTHYFFVPYRIIDETFEEMITGGIDGTSEEVVPLWEIAQVPTEGSLWDYMGFPLLIPTGKFPALYPKAAYYTIFNEYYRDETLQAEAVINPATAGTILKRNWEKDYFTSALPWQQRGDGAALPIAGTASAEWDLSNFSTVAGSNNVTINANEAILRAAVTNGSLRLQELFNNNEIDLSVASTFDIADLRLAFQLQRWQERNARSGVRYTEFLRAHFNSYPNDERLDRPEYIGGSKSPVIISEVMQTSESNTTPQGNLAGKGISVDGTFVGSYNVKEFGLIMGIMSVMPRTAYTQGINRQWLKETRYDFYFPEFCNLSEQAIYQAELYATSVEAENNVIFGYQGHFDEMRVKQSMVCSGMRSDFDEWHLARVFTSAPALNTDFIQCNPSKRIFAVTEEDGLIVNVRNKIIGIRPLPIIAEPGLLDHI